MYRSRHSEIPIYEKAICGGKQTFDEFVRRRHAGIRGAEERKEEFNFYGKRIETFNSFV